MDVERYDARTGGSWAYTHSDENGVHAFRGVFLPCRLPVDGGP